MSIRSPITRAAEMTGRRAERELLDGVLAAIQAGCRRQHRDATGSSAAQSLYDLGDPIRLRADKADLYLTKNASTSDAASRVPNPRGSLDHMIAEGRIQVDEGTRKGEGQRLVYTASDGKFILYGRTDQPAHMADPEHGTVSGAALIFTNRGDSVEVDGGNARAVTDTQVPK